MSHGFEKVSQIATRKNLTPTAGKISGSGSAEGGGESRLPVRLDMAAEELQFPRRLAGSLLYAIRPVAEISVQRQLGHRNGSYALQYARPSFSEMGGDSTRSERFTRR